MGTYMYLKHLQSLDDKKVVLRCLWQTCCRPIHSFTLKTKNKAPYLYFYLLVLCFFPYAF